MKVFSSLLIMGLLFFMITALTLSSLNRIIPSAVGVLFRPFVSDMKETKYYNGIPRPAFTPERITELKADEVFVFGSNLAGMHGGGAAYMAFRLFGAVMGCGVGLRGQSYAIPTMQGGVETIKPYVDDFIAFAQEHPELFFYVTSIGCGIAGFREKEIAPLFSEAVDVPNICLPEGFMRLLK